MRTMKIEAGATIFQAGEPSLAVYVIEEGEVAIRVGHGQTETEIARLQAGELFGEAGVLEARPRSARAVAMVATTLLVTEAQTFLSAFGLENDRALAVIKLLCRRLRGTNLRAAEAGSAQAETALVAMTFADGNPATNFPPAAIRITPGNERLASEFGVAPVDVRHLPFQVGNRYGGETVPIASNGCLGIPARGETDLSAPHFELVRRGGKVSVRDLGSRHGTIVNGVAINRASVDPFVPLHVGRNRLIAGRANSPFSFDITLQGATTG